MKVKRTENILAMRLAQKAEFIGREVNGFKLLSESQTPQGVIILEYTYEKWNFTATMLIIPILDSGFCQIVDSL